MAIVSNQKDLDFLFNLKEEDITSSLLMDLFGEFDGKQKFHPEDIIKVPSNTYKVNNKFNKNSFTTTVGLWVFNKLYIEKELTHVLGYINKTVTSKVFSELNTKLSYALVEDKITLEQLKRFLMKTQFTTPLCSFLSPNYTEKMLMTSKNIESKKKQLIKENKEALDNGDATTIDKVESELLNYAIEQLQDDPSLDIYKSGARGTLENNFKNMYVSRGAIRNPTTQKYDVIMSSYTEGIKKEEFTTLANSLAAGPYARAAKTAKGGYQEKMFVKAMQHVIALPKGSDCGTKRYVEMTLTPKVLETMMYSYIIEGNRLVRLDSSNMDKYKGKKVKFRFSSMCEAKDGICNKCIGDMPYVTDTVNVGLATSILPARIKLKSMKAFHDSTVKLVDMDVDKLFNN